MHFMTEECLGDIMLLGFSHVLNVSIPLDWMCCDLICLFLCVAFVMAFMCTTRGVSSMRILGIKSPCKLLKC